MGLSSETVNHKTASKGTPFMGPDPCMKALAIGVSPITLSPSGAGVIRKRKIWSAPVHHLRRNPPNHDLQTPPHEPNWAHVVHVSSHGKHV